MSHFEWSGRGNGERGEPNRRCDSVILCENRIMNNVLVKLPKK
jgi:hypothetical protein